MWILVVSYLEDIETILTSSQEDAYKFACSIILEEISSWNPGFLLIEELRGLISNGLYKQAFDVYVDNCTDVCFYISKIEVKTHPGF